MTSSKSITATFNTAAQTSSSNITVGSSGAESTIQNGYDDAETGATIELQAGKTYVENDNFNKNISVSLKGGYDSSFTTDNLYSVITGPLIISSGTVTVWNIIIQ